MNKSAEPSRLRRILSWLSREPVTEVEAPLEVPTSLTQVLQNSVEAIAGLLEERHQRVRAVLGHRHDTLWLDEDLGQWIGRTVAWNVARTPEGGQLELRTFEAAGRTVIKMWSDGPARAIGDQHPPAPAGVELWAESAPAVGFGFALECRQVDMPDGSSSSHSAT